MNIGFAFSCVCVGDAHIFSYKEGLNTGILKKPVGARGVLWARKRRAHGEIGSGAYGGDELGWE